MAEHNRRGSCSSERDGLAGGLSHCDSEILVSSVFASVKDLRILHFQMIDGKKSGELPVGSFYAHHFCSHFIGENSVSRLCLHCKEAGKCSPTEYQGKKSHKKGKEGQ